MGQDFTQSIGIECINDHLSEDGEYPILPNDRGLNSVRRVGYLFSYSLSFEITAMLVPEYILAISRAKRLTTGTRLSFSLTTSE